MQLPSVRRPLCVRGLGREVILGSQDALDTLHQWETPWGQPCLASAHHQLQSHAHLADLGPPRKFPNAGMWCHNPSCSVMSISGRAAAGSAPPSPYSLHLLCSSLPPCSAHHSSLAAPYRHCVREPKAWKTDPTRTEWVTWPTQPPKQRPQQESCTAMEVGGHRIPLRLRHLHC